jgi:hypothetical protein
MEEFFRVYRKVLLLYGKIINISKIINGIFEKFKRRLAKKYIIPNLQI